MGKHLEDSLRMLRKTSERDWRYDAIEASALDERELRDRIAELEEMISRAPCEKATSFSGFQLMPECHKIPSLEARQWCGVCKLKWKAGLLATDAKRDEEG